MSYDIIINLSKSPERYTLSGNNNITIFESTDIKDILLDIGLIIYVHMKQPNPETLYINIYQDIHNKTKQYSWDPVYQYLCRYGIPMKITDINQYREEQSQKYKRIRIQDASTQQEEEKKQEQETI